MQAQLASGKQSETVGGKPKRATGDPVIYIIGIDDKTGDVHDVSNTDVLDWWNQIVAKFEHTPPEMIRHMETPTDGGAALSSLGTTNLLAPLIRNVASRLTRAV